MQLCRFVAILVCAVAALVHGSDARAQNQWESEILAFEAADLAAPPPTGSVVFTGSSTIRLWTTISADLAPLGIISRGFGGSTADDLDYYLARVVFAYQPRAVVLYEGDNDIAAGLTPEYVANRMSGILARISTQLPSTRVYLLSIKPSPLRWSLWPLASQTNALFAALCAADARYTYINAAPALLGGDGLPRPDYYQSDQLHLNASGYQAWTAAIRPTLHAQQLNPLPPDATAPTSPSGLTATAVSSSRVDLRWTSSVDSGTGLGGYRVSRNGLFAANTTASSFSDVGRSSNTAYTYTVSAFDRASPSANESVQSPQASATTLPASAALALRVNAAGPAYTDVAGNSWSADTGFNTGTAASYATSTSIAGTSDPTLYRSERWDSSVSPELAYSFTVPNGTYQVRLHFAENYSGNFGVGKRIFSVQAEGTLVIQNLDIFATVGANTTLVRTVSVPVSDGQLNLTFIHSTENPLVNGIEVIAQSVTPDTELPSAPGTLTATVIGPNQVNLAWGAATDNVGVAGYEIERCTGTGCTGFAPLATVTGLAFSNTTVTASTTYRYRIRARDAAGNLGAYGTLVSASTPAVPPAAPTVSISANPSAVANGASALLNWSTTNATSCSATDGWGGSKTTSGSAQTSPLTLTTIFGLACDGPGGSSTAYTTVTVAPAPDTELPSAPGTLTATVIGPNQVNLAWGAATDNVGVAGYDIERCTGTGCTGFAPLATVTGLAFSNTTVTASTTYRYRIRARDAAGNLGAYGTLVSASTPAVAAFALRVNAAGPAYTDAAGNSWSADTGFNTGITASYSTSTSIAGTSDPTLYRSERWDSSVAPELAYSFTVPNGTYQVRLHFAENYSGNFGVGKRIFSVQAEGTLVIQNLDIFAAVGANTALVRTVSVPVSDGQLNLTFIHSTENPLVNGIEVIAQSVSPDTELPSAPGTLTATVIGPNQVNLAWGAATDNVGVAGYDIERCTGTGCTGFAPLATVTGLAFSNTTVTASTTYRYRIRARDAAGNLGAYGTLVSASTPAVAAFALRVNAAGPAYTDAAGNSWSADTGFNTGITASYSTSTSIAGTSDPTLYRSERWDSSVAPELAYSFTVPNGTYQVRLHFAENYSGNFGVGKRIFSVQAEGTLVIQNLDIFAAVGANTALVRTVSVPVSDGQLNLTFIHSTENPLVNGIEVVPAP